MPMAVFHWLAMGARCGYSASRSPATTPGSVALHHHAAAEGALIRVAIQAGQRGAFGGAEQLQQYRVALLVQGLRGCWPVDGNCTLRPVVVLQTGLVRQRDSAHATFSASGCAGSGAVSRVSSARLRSTPHR